MVGDVRTDSGFRLSKWYLDCVTDEGGTFIGYVASLRWKIFSLHFSSILIRHANGTVRTRTSLLPESDPCREGQSVAWSFQPFHLDAKWDSLLKGIERTLYKTGTGEIAWSCISPLARASIRLGNSRPIEGFGYVEYMTLSIPPWQLPITELRWGRFLNRNESLVWIDWKGVQPKSLLLHNGEEAGSPSVSDTEIRGDPDIRLSLASHAVLRSGPIVSTTLSRIPGLKSILPTDVLSLHECKWLSRADLRSGTTAPSSGWAIHELVKFR